MPLSVDLMTKRAESLSKSIMEKSSEVLIDVFLIIWLTWGLGHYDLLYDHKIIS